jgi:hypothetical protein
MTAVPGPATRARHRNYLDFLRFGKSDNRRRQPDTGVTTLYSAA